MLVKHVLLQLNMHVWRMDVEVYAHLLVVKEGYPYRLELVRSRRRAALSAVGESSSVDITFLSPVS